MTKPILSVVISAYNAANTINKTLESVKYLAEEIIVVDNNSSDNTRAVARKFTQKIFSRPNNPMLNISKNFGFSKAHGAWILNLDADEEIPGDLAEEIKSVIATKKNNSPDYAGYWISRKNISFGKWIKHGIWWPDKQLRLFKKDKGIFPENHIHEYVKVDGPVGELCYPYHHYNYDNISQFITKLDRCTTSESEYLIQSGYQPVWHDALAFPVSDFVKIYFSQEGYKDGLHGLVLALLQSFYSFTVFAKVWEKRDFPQADPNLKSIYREINKNMGIIRYWILTAFIKASDNIIAKSIYRLARKVANLFTI